MYLEPEDNKKDVAYKMNLANSNFESEYNSLRRGVGIRDISDSLMIKLTGKDTLDFIHRVSTNSVKDLMPLNKVNTLFTNEKGRFIDRTVFLNMEDYFLLIGSPDPEQKLNVWLNRYIIMEDIKTSIVNGEFSLFQIHGPQSTSYMAMICGNEMESLGDNNIMFVQVDGVSFYFFKFFEYKDFYSYYLLTGREQSQKILDYFFENKSAFDLNKVSDEVYDAYRIEHGIPRFPNEINDNFNPHENGLTNEISFTKGCYIGQEVIARLDTYNKVQRELKGVVFQDHDEIEAPSVLHDSNENEIGVITSIADPALFDKKIGLAYIRNKFELDNSETEVYSDSGKKLHLKITNLPFPNENLH